MTNYGSGYDRARAAFKAACAARNEPCWICHNQLGPIDYVTKYDPAKKQPLLFSLDHADPVSLGHDPMRTDRWRASHLRCNVSRGNTTRGMFPTTRKW
jgi:hypothetical protein